jgi:hypothetical protein
MQDALFLLVTLVFFALTRALVAFAGRLERGDGKEGKP